MKKKLLWLLAILVIVLAGAGWLFKTYADNQIQHHEDPGLPEGFPQPPDPDSVE
ncbi:hypothetical protein N9A86_00940 [Akkermansiaceae bacterium]|nr:hypothetical protein [Akkermansiaceae bacterium]MDB4544318.1 hypothetical protein [Akkermansiaceae bacterium]